MFKKTISLALAVIMLLTVLTGCTTNELGYLKMSKELSALTQFSFENTTNIEISEEAAGDSYDATFNLNGAVNIEDLNAIYMNFDITFSVNGLESKEPINFVIADNNLYVSKNLVLEVIPYDELFNGEATESKEVIDDLYYNGLKDAEYILLADLDEYYDIDYEADYQAMQDDAVQYLTSAFKGFDSRLITKINGGYSIELTAESAVEFIERLITYISANRELVFDETVSYLEKIYTNTEYEGMTAEDKEELIAEIKESRQDFYDFLDEAELMLETDELDYFEDMLHGSSINQDIYKTGSTYKENSNAELWVEGIMMGRLSSDTVITPENIEKISITEGIMTIEELEDLYNKTENKLNPANSMQLDWYPDSYNTQIDLTRKNGKNSWDSQPYTIIENRVYLPLRYIGETFGEEVYWDNDARKAYVIRGNEKIDMTGVIIDSRTMVKVRDFEKLGYKITYTLDGSLSTAVIEK